MNHNSYSQSPNYERINVVDETKIRYEQLEKSCSFYRAELERTYNHVIQKISSNNFKSFSSSNKRSQYNRSTFSSSYQYYNKNIFPSYIYDPQDSPSQKFAKKWNSKLSFISVQRKSYTSNNSFDSFDVTSIKKKEQRQSSTNSPSEISKDHPDQSSIKKSPHYQIKDSDLNPKCIEKSDQHFSSQNKEEEESIFDFNEKSSDNNDHFSFPNNFHYDFSFQEEEARNEEQNEELHVSDLGDTSSSHTQAYTGIPKPTFESDSSTSF